MTRITSEMQSRKQLLEKKLKNVNTLLKSAPKGGLRSCKRGNQFYYYSTMSGKKPDTYIRVKKIKAKLLAQKEYLIKVQKLINNELAYLNSRYKYPAKTYENALSELSPGKQILVEPIWLSDDAYITEWKSHENEYEHKKFDKEEESEYFTTNHERVRSKSELMIANTLEKFGIPYYYEYRIDVPGLGTIYPDFRVLNVRQRHEYFWEHDGMMDHDGYRKKLSRRILWYERNGYFPGRNLIMTFEDKDNPLSQINIEDNIREYLL